MVVWGIFSIITIVPTFLQLKIPVQYYLYTWTFIFFACFVTLYFQWKRMFLYGRLLGLAMMLTLAWDGVILFGRDFNGFLMLFPALAYSIIAFSRYSGAIRIITTAICFLSLPLVDYVSYHGILPVTGFKTEDFPIATLMFPSFIIMGFMTIALTLEKSFSDKYEGELTDLNENLEKIVEKRTKLLVDAKEEAIQASLLKSQFVANTSHELRTPVQGIVGFVGMAKRRLSKVKDLDESNEALKSKIEKSLDSADISSARLLELIDTLLNITRTEAVGFTPRPTMVSLKSLIEQVVHEVSNGESSIGLDLNYSTDTLDIHTDPTLLTQILQNLFGNAVRYSTGGSNARIEVRSTGDIINIDVTNTGVGIEESEKQSIFEPFVQGSRTDQSTGGTGLGLALCKKYAEALGGQVSLKDASPENTVFTLVIPQKLEVNSV